MHKNNIAEVLLFGDVLFMGSGDSLSMLTGQVSDENIQK